MGVRPPPGQEEVVRPIVTLKRSHTIVGPAGGPAPVHYGYSRTFKAKHRGRGVGHDGNNNSVFGNGGGVSHQLRGRGGGVATETSNRKRRKSLSPSAYYNHADRQMHQQQQSSHLYEYEEFCEFQVSFTCVRSDSINF